MSAVLTPVEDEFPRDRQVAQLRIPPHSIEAESSVLGGLLLDNGAWDRMGDLLTDSDFYRYEHRLIFAAIGGLINATKPADVITVFEQLQSLGKAEEVGGLAYLNSLAQYVPSAGNIRRYAEIVRERSILRKLVSASDEIATAAFNPQGKAVDRILDEAEQKIFNIGEEGSRMKQGFQGMDSLVVELLDRVQEMSDNPNDITGVPTGFYDLDRMTSGMQAGDMIVLAARPSMGKAQPVDAKVRTLTGWKAMGELEVGDAVASVDGRPSIVTGIYPQGVKQVFRVTFSDGRSAECCADHLWKVHCRHWPEARVLQTSELQALLARKRYQNRVWIEPATGEFGHEDPLPVDPWVLGALLGSGSLSGSGSVMCSAASVKALQPLGARVGDGMEVVHADVTVSLQPDLLRVALEGLGLLDLPSDRTFIPRLYLEANRAARVDLLRGLLGSDECAEPRSAAELSTMSRQLSDDVAELVRSLGGWCSIHTEQLHVMNVAGMQVGGLSAYVCHISLSENPQERRRLNVVTITPTRQAQCQCIAVSHPDKLYITDQDVVTHNTSLAINIAEHVALHEGLPVAVFSMEMGASQLAVRIVGSIGRIDQGHLRTGKLTDDEWPRLTEAIEKLRNISLFIDETPGLTPSELRANARRLSRQCGKLGLIVVDYLQLMSGSGGGADENRATELGEISRGLKMLAKELQCPVIALSQLNRGVETRTDKRPMMSDLRESGAIEQDADVIMFIYRDDYYNKDSKEPGVAEVIIGKQRNGPTGTIKLAFLKPLTKFESLASGGTDF
ncbi:MAG: replicative DNA helicase [Burkholderiales bacterium]|nr:replicative DNA helicase [Burkholderiales bacterium]